jgi:hypothetical protein
VPMVATVEPPRYPRMTLRITGPAQNAASGPQSAAMGSLATCGATRASASASLHGVTHPHGTTAARGARCCNASKAACRSQQRAGERVCRARVRGAGLQYAMRFGAALGSCETKLNA